MLLHTPMLHKVNGEMVDVKVDKDGRIRFIISTICPVVDAATGNRHIKLMDRVVMSYEVVRETCEKCGRPLGVYQAKWAEIYPVFHEEDTIEDLYLVNTPAPLGMGMWNQMGTCGPTGWMIHIPSQDAVVAVIGYEPLRHSRCILCKKELIGKPIPEPATNTDEKNIYELTLGYHWVAEPDMHIIEETP